MTARRRLAELGVALPPAIPPAFHYASVVSSGEHAYVSGQLPKTGRDQELLHTGIVPEGVSLEQARACARLCAINALAVLEAELGEGAIDRVAQIVQVTGYVAATPSFDAHPKVIDGASTFLSEVFGERGRHARAAVGVSSLPRGAPVEIAFVVRMDPADVSR